jgi:hypothetical protein
MFDILGTKLINSDIENKRQEISRLLIQKSKNIKNATITAISIADLELLFKLYDEIFLESWFMQNYKGKLKFSVSRQMTKSAGLTRCPKNIDSIRPEELVIEVKLGIDFFFHYGLVEGSRMVGGIDTESSLEALQLVFEHELCHVIEFIHFGRSSCKKERFKTMAGNLFGHTESYHKLPTPKQIASNKLGINIGDTVAFTFEGKDYKGILYNINKRAIVMVRDKNGRLIDKQNRRYTKYYVPLSLIE